MVGELVRHLEECFSSLKEDWILSTAAIIEPHRWPIYEDELARFGDAEVSRCLQRFEKVLMKNGCDLDIVQYEWSELKRHVLSKPRSAWPHAWKDVFCSRYLKEKFSNILHLVELIMVLPLATSLCEKGFTCLQRIHGDWRSSLPVDMVSKLMFILMNGPSSADYDPSSAVDQWWHSGST